MSDNKILSFPGPSDGQKTDGLPGYNKVPYGGGEPPGGDMMEHRVKHLETDMQEVKAALKGIDDRLRGVETRAAEISGKISNLPGWPGLLAIAGLIVTAVGLMLRFMPPSLPG